jgi:hypothetical protein
MKKTLLAMTILMATTAGQARATTVNIDFAGEHDDLWGPLS